MKERLITLLTALAALGLTIFLLAPPQPPVEPISLPTTEDRGSEGLKGVYSWLHREQLPLVSLRNRYTELYKSAVKAQRGNVLVISMPAPKEISDAEWRALKLWISKGNSLLILGAVYYRPAWAGEENCFCDVKKFLRGFAWLLDYESLEPESDGRDDIAQKKTFKEKIEAMQANVKSHIPVQDKLATFSKHPLLQNVRQLETQTTAELLRKKWTLAATNADNLALALLKRSDAKLSAFWQIKAGEGQVFLSLAPDLFSNTRLNHADNARFLINLLDQALAKDGTLIFDDYHFGLSELYDPEHFFQDSRLHRTLGFLGLLWLLYVIGYTDRLAPVRAASLKLSIGDFVAGTAGFFARRLKKRALAAELVSHLLLDIRMTRKLRDEEQAWHWLEQHAQITSGQLSLLKRAKLQRRVSLMQLADAVAHIRTVTL